MDLRDALAAAHARIEALERALEEASVERRRLLGEIDRLASRGDETPPAPSDPVREQYVEILDMARSGGDELAALLQRVVRSHPEHDLTSELLDRVRCSACRNSVARPDSDADDMFWRGLCPACGGRWFLLQ